MAVSRSYKMPWTTLDAAAIRAAAEAVAASLHGVRAEAEVERPDFTAWTFWIPRELARRWPGNRVHLYADDELVPGPIPVQIDFKYLPGDADSPGDLFLMSVDAGYPATNGLCWGTATEIIEQLNRQWGDSGERW